MARTAGWGWRPNRWRAGLAGAAVTDHIDQYAFSDIHSAVATYYGGSPFTDPKRLQASRDQAPITYATTIKAPTLVLSDTGDQRVPDHRVVHALSRDARQRRGDEVHRVPGERPFPE